MLEQRPELFASFIKKPTVKLYYCLHSFIQVCEYLEYLISLQTFLLFDYNGSALKNTNKSFSRKASCSLQKQWLLFEKRRLLEAPTKVGFTIFFLKISK